MILYVGRLIAVKGVSDLVRAAGGLDPAEARVVIVGDGPEGPDLEDLATREAPGRVVFAGFREGSDLTDLYAAADVFVLPSHHEPWGVVVGEAMASGLPVILSDHIGAGADLLRDGENGRVFPAGDVTALGTILRDLAANAAGRAEMGRRSDAIMDGWTYETSVREFERAVQAATGRTT